MFQAAHLLEDPVCVVPEQGQEACQQPGHEQLLLRELRALGPRLPEVARHLQAAQVEHGAQGHPERVGRTLVANLRDGRGKGHGEGKG